MPGAPREIHWPLRVPRLDRRLVWSLCRVSREGNLRPSVELINQQTNSMKEKKLSFAARIECIADIADLVRDVAEMDERGNAAALLAAARFLREESLRMAEVLQRLKKHDTRRSDKARR